MTLMSHEEGDREHICEQGEIRNLESERERENMFNAEIDGDGERLHAVRNRECIKRNIMHGIR